MTQHSATRSMFDPALLRPAIVDSFKKLTPRTQFRNPVMFCVYVGSILTTILWIAALAGQAEAPAGFILAIALWLWFTVLFANFAEALAEGRSKAQAASLRSAKKDVLAKKLNEPHPKSPIRITTASDLRRGDVVLVEAGDVIPADGEVIDGVASVDESAITGESAPVIRESGGDFSSVTGGTRVLSDWIVVTVTANPGEAFLDRMIAMVEGAKRKKTPNEVALTILLVALTIVMLLATATLLPFSMFSVEAMKAGHVVTITALVALLVCLIPTTIGGLLSAIGVAGMSRMMQANVIATSGRAVEAAGDVDVLLLDKTGTITLGNRQASMFVPAPGVTEEALADAAQLSSLADETPEGRSIVVLAKERFNIRQRDMAQLHATFLGFSAQTRMSGVDLFPEGTPAGTPGREIRKGAADAIRRYVETHGGRFPEEVRRAVDDVARRGSTPLVVADLHDGVARVLGVIELKDIVKGGIKERFAELRKMGIKTVMVTGDNRLTAAAIAAEAGVDDFLAEATPETKLATIREHQTAGRLVAMTGDGTNDAPALAQADVAVAMNTGTQAAKEAGNMVDLDSNPTKLIEIVEIGKQMLMTRGSLTTFSIANDIAKYFAIIPAAFVTTYPQLRVLDIMHLSSPASAILSAVIFNALIIVALIPLALKGVPYRPLGAASLLRRNLLVYGLGGLLLPFPFIKLIDMTLAALGWA
ncbi:potassium-transporting ATPase subunit KdpB [Burkholderia ambifaria]|uniref:Potassium-transporting ATPase ATP-binding subunit n=1 Tax=Burkholderia ambifaria (strain ATCC BAA-244 / DSM 16087 / CCUG 44356 / LMG 19182 / AMMD) TaxID=339670 RepID=Q0BD92_BURCM|nr:potassium-transporting ATPase subunit KdpB [Burkholderia ambifaria]ABI87881.1 K+-transporting ATPase, B subunit [Burkholderia ambifaria AMMD]ELK6207893.1 potassium-transporting ATPase subunit KdpB [Burkholderia ambifaria]MBR7934472.1 potassium-transporting ATPase subunit KdpB [Burkholderia ambifaria]PEH64944.1 K(+)-transporting ATPase subunit B [Burkholderia ambifaria]QQC04924.1 potassium-transporting ATPase subunit KdpB [Burkholderia ambifaria]